MMMTEMKWPGFLELPLLLLFMLVVTLVFILLLATDGEDGTHGRASLEDRPAEADPIRGKSR